MNRERAMEMLRAGRRVRPHHWTKGTWLQSAGGDKLVDHKGRSRPGITKSWPADGWVALKPATPRAELRAQLAKATERYECADRCLETMRAEAREAQAENEQLRNELGPAVRLADVMTSLRLKAEERTTADLAKMQELKEYAAAWRSSAESTGQEIVQMRAQVADLQRQLAEARDHVATPEDAWDRYKRTDKRLTAAMGELSAARATITRLEGQLAEARATRPEPLLLKLLRENPDKAISSPSRPNTYVRRSERGIPRRIYAVEGMSKPADSMDFWAPPMMDLEATDWHVVEPAKPAEPVWTPCSASEAREKHATGMRVRRSGQPDEWASDLWLHRGEASRHSPMLHPVNFAKELLSELALSDYTSGWSWSEEVTP